jgi:hypothetical protein
MVVDETALPVRDYRSCNAEPAAVGRPSARDVPLMRWFEAAESEGRSHRDAWVGCIVSSATANSSAVRVSRSTCSRSRALNTVIVWALS